MLIDELQTAGVLSSTHTNTPNDEQHLVTAHIPARVAILEDANGDQVPVFRHLIAKSLRGVA